MLKYYEKYSCDYYYYYYYYYYGSTALCWALAAFIQFLDPTHSR
jgi:hypothetical protein